MTDDNFVLSEKIFETRGRKIYAEQEVIFKTDVKEFIRRLKEEHRNLYRSKYRREEFLKILDKISGEELI